ncbi:MAG: sugar transferase [Lachnospiraceae bacterium]|jgi:undecaprenyl phosphate N,N'-diacetylbacillosamine 1-phosphate transferase|nr:sugar transferase [Lachnospiraceae bacterium]
MYARCFKPLCDFIGALLGLIILSPVYLIVAVLVRVKLGSPILFKQERPGKNERVFRLFKFRTMTDARDESGVLLPDAVRLTGFGKFLRSTSLDELPELFNILRGEMSFIGPRPLLVTYLPYYSEREKIRHAVRPGLTGLAQVSGRNYLNWDDRMAKDVEYVEQLGVAMDIKVIAKTVGTVFGQRDSVAADTNAAEGNFAQIRRERLEKTGRLEP